MSERDSNLFERQLSRFLDDEMSSGERRDFKRQLRDDPDAAARFDQESAFDREFGYALRSALQRTAAPRRLRTPARIARFATLAVAAGLAVVFLRPGETPSGRPSERVARATSWFAPPPGVSDDYSSDARLYERPRIRVDDATRNWIVVPSGRAGEYLIVEVKRVRTRSVAVQEDF